MRQSDAIKKWDTSKADSIESIVRASIATHSTTIRSIHILQSFHFCGRAVRMVCFMCSNRQWALMMKCGASSFFLKKIIGPGPLRPDNGSLTSFAHQHGRKTHGCSRGARCRRDVHRTYRPRGLDAQDGAGFVCQVSWRDHSGMTWLALTHASFFHSAVRIGATLFCKARR